MFRRSLSPSELFRVSVSVSLRVSLYECVCVRLGCAARKWTVFALLAHDFGGGRDVVALTYYRYRDNLVNPLHPFFYKKHFQPSEVSMFLKVLPISRSKCFLDVSQPTYYTTSNQDQISQRSPSETISTQNVNRNRIN